MHAELIVIFQYPNEDNIKKFCVTYFKFLNKGTVAHISMTHKHYPAFISLMLRA